MLQKNSQFLWAIDQENCFNKSKQLLTSEKVLAHYDPKNETRIETDASSYGIGVALFQNVQGTWRAVTYASRTLTGTERRYAVIEKEMLAICFACSRFRDYLVGLPKFEISTDHSPLVALLNKKNLDELPIRLQRMRLKIAGLPYQVRYVKGVTHVTADCLSRAPMNDSS